MESAGLSTHELPSTANSHEISPPIIINNNKDNNNSRSNADEEVVSVDHHATVFHAHRVRAALVVSLALTIIVTILVVQALTPCNFGLAAVFSCLWGFLLSYSWNSHSMLRIAVVPGGRESEFAGLYLAAYSSMIWLPLFVFSVANEIWNIDGALYILTIFMGIGGFVLFFVNLERGLLTRLNSLSERRWAHAVDVKQVEHGEVVSRK